MNRVGHILILSVFLFPVVRGLAQNFTGYERYFLTEMVFNPAVAGTANSPVAILSTRKTWSGLPQTPRLSMFNSHFRISDLFNDPRDFISSSFPETGLGVGVHHDVNGPLRVTAAQLALACHIPVSKTSVVSAGIAPKIYQCVLGEDQFKATDPGDPDLTFVRQSATFVNFNAGLYLRSGNLSAGFSNTNLASLTDATRNFYNFENLRSWYFSCRYKIVFSEDVALEPYLVLRAHDRDRRADILVRQQLGRNFSVGVGYATRNALSFLVSLHHKGYSAGYLFESVSSPLRSYSRGNHMFFIGHGIW